MSATDAHMEREDNTSFEDAMSICTHRARARADANGKRLEGRAQSCTALRPFLTDLPCARRVAVRQRSLQINRQGERWTYAAKGRVGRGDLSRVRLVEQHPPERSCSRRPCRARSKASSILPGTRLSGRMRAGVRVEGHTYREHAGVCLATKVTLIALIL